MWSRQKIPTVELCKKLMIFHNHKHQSILQHKVMALKSHRKTSPSVGIGVSILRCEPILVCTMLPGGSAADIRVMAFDSREADIHIRGQLIAKFIPFRSKVRIFHCASPGTFV